MNDIRKRAGKGPRWREHRRTAARRRRGGWKARALLALAALAAAAIVWAVAARHWAPQGNTSLSRFDAIIVLGFPVNADGNPMPTQLERVTEAVHEYERGVAPRLIVTGGAVANPFVEAQVMARTAAAQGVPEAAIIEEPNARNTIENACYAARIMKAHGWTSAEVVSSPSHLPRAGLIFSQMPIEWRAHAAPLLQPRSTVNEAAVTALETLKTVRHLLWAQWSERCEP